MRFQEVQGVLCVTLEVRVCTLFVSQATSSGACMSFLGSRRLWPTKRLDLSPLKRDVSLGFPEALPTRGFFRVGFPSDRQSKIPTLKKGHPDTSWNLSKAFGGIPGLFRLAPMCSKISAKLNADQTTREAIGRFRENDPLFMYLTWASTICRRGVSECPIPVAHPEVLTIDWPGGVGSLGLRVDSSGSSFLVSPRRKTTGQADGLGI